MTERRFSLEEQKAFAALSGDWNPLHVDPDYARRCLHGRIAVHGIHAVLWALDAWLAENRKAVGIRSIKADFLRPIGLETPVTCVITVKAERHLIMTVESDGTEAVRVDVEWQDQEPSPATLVPIKSPAAAAPKNLDPTEMERRAGSLELFYDRKAAASLFPHLAGLLSPRDAAILMATSRLVGMDCPGLHSMFSELFLTSSPSTVSGSAGLNYQVLSLDRRFGLVTIQVNAPGISGDVKAFIRPKPQEQADYAAVKRAVMPQEFAGQRALIVGGSRGLGELTAKIVAAGGGEVRITYCQGQVDAGRVVEDIRSGGGVAESSRLDVLDKSGQTLDGLAAWRPNHLYYFATPYIFSGRRGCFSPALFDQFSRYYVTGFARVMEALKGGLRGAFYPSSTALDDRPPDMSEYVAAKTAGESLCATFEKTRPGTVILCPRLPRLATDQTMSLVPVQNLDPLPVLFGVLRSFRQMTGAGAPLEALRAKP